MHVPRDGGNLAGQDSSCAVGVEHQVYVKPDGTAHGLVVLGGLVNDQATP